MIVPFLALLIKKSRPEKVKKLEPEKKAEAVSPEAVMAMTLLKAHLDQKAVDEEEISGLFYFNPVVKSLTADSDIALRHVPNGGIPGRGIYSEDVGAFVGRLIYLAGYAFRREDGSISLTIGGSEVCLSILWDEARYNSAGLEILAKAMDFKPSDLLRCFEPDHNYRFSLPPTA